MVFCFQSSSIVDLTTLGYRAFKHFPMYNKCHNHLNEKLVGISLNTEPPQLRHIPLSDYSDDNQQILLKKLIKVIESLSYLPDGDTSSQLLG